MGVVGMGLSVLERARGGQCAGVCAACCGAVRRSRGGGDARACRGQGAGVMCDGAADFLISGIKKTGGLEPLAVFLRFPTCSAYVASGFLSRFSSKWHTKR
jgi:hypothetical protein